MEISRNVILSAAKNLVLRPFAALRVTSECANLVWFDLATRGTREDSRKVEAMDEQLQRIDTILGGSIKRGFTAAVKVFFEHLRRSLVLPCEVTGIEDFQWEEVY